ncbi:MAG: UDP-4-amino-4,6-dideoxy-N-acetyl-beta-L-altrosamine transaminase [Synergistaceae bacterium]|jgi:UDP-4-amino-4,6-dideoxy-N-acetyl-beta-L-altrosamine transaminase|nr:UDP-4-amino-4,6-dideoxy-N-acetyl-beta-L-altrosamine transaminase [Synergistaceae bacterium]
MSEIFLPYGRQSISEDDIEAVISILRGDWLTTGPMVEKFEGDVADYVGVAHAVSFSSGTAALHGAMHAAGVAPGSAAVAPSLTFAATANSVIYCGGRPVLADISPDTLCLDPGAVEAAAGHVAEPVRAIVPVSFAGYPVKITDFRDAANRLGALVIEDASHALGAERGLHKVGQEADMTVFSFHPVKHITTAEGGMVVTNSAELAKRLRLFRSHGIVKSPEDFVRAYAGAWDNDMVELGYNYRLTDMASALGASQLKNIDYFVMRRKEIAVMYREMLSEAPDIVLPPDHPGHSYHLFPIWVDGSRRKDVFDRLRGNGIGVQVHYVPLHLHTYYREKFAFFEGDFPLTEKFSSGEISLPIFPDMLDEHVELVVKNLALALGAR